PNCYSSHMSTDSAPFESGNKQASILRVRSHPLSGTSCRPVDCDCRCDQWRALPSNNISPLGSGRIQILTCSSWNALGATCLPVQLFLVVRICIVSLLSHSE